MAFYISKLKIFAYVLLAIGFVVAGVFMIDSESIKAKIAGWLSIAFFGFGALVLARQLFKSNGNPSVVINEDGIIDYRTNVGLVPWDDIRHVWIGEVRSQKFLCVETYSNKQQVPALASAGNSLMGFPSITVAFNGLNPDLKAAVVHIRAVQPAKFLANAA